MNGMYPPVPARRWAGRSPCRRRTRSCAPAWATTATAVLNCITPFDSSHNLYYEAALCGGVNDWLRTEFLERDPRLRASLLVPTLDPDAAVAEIERLGSHPGFVQVLLPIRTRGAVGQQALPPHARRRGPARARPGSARLGPGRQRADAERLHHLLPRGLRGELADRRPGPRHEPRERGLLRALRRSCKVAMLECGFTWLPFLLWRFDKDWKGVWREVPWVKERPSAYVLRSMRFSTAPAALPTDPAVLARIPDLMPVADLLMYASDHPAPPRRHGRAAARGARRGRAAGDPVRQRLHALRTVIFEGFEAKDIDTGEATIHTRVAGNGPPLLLLHGYPQTASMWHAVAPALAEDRTVVVPDLRGYGASSKPATTEDHEPYSKRAMARDHGRRHGRSSGSTASPSPATTAARASPTGSRSTTPSASRGSRSSTSSRRRRCHARTTRLGARRCGTGSSSPSLRPARAPARRATPRASTSARARTCSTPRRWPSTRPRCATRP